MKMTLTKSNESDTFRGFTDRNNQRKFMYAVIQTGGKQYRVQPGDVLEVELLDGDKGTEIALDDVLLVADGENISVGRPKVDGARVTAEIVEPDEKGDKVIAFKFKRRKGYHRKIGIRPRHTVLKIKDIKVK
jgi:large subunit ribosomal protein L21